MGESPKRMLPTPRIMWASGLKPVLFCDNGVQRTLSSTESIMLVCRLTSVEKLNKKYSFNLT